MNMIENLHHHLSINVSGSKAKRFNQQHCPNTIQIILIKLVQECKFKLFSFSSNIQMYLLKTIEKCNHINIKTGENMVSLITTVHKKSFIAVPSANVQTKLPG